MATGTGENTSKIVNDVLLAPKTGAGTSKLVNYVLLSTETKLETSKVVNYVLIGEQYSGAGNVYLQPLLMEALDARVQQFNVRYISAMGDYSEPLQVTVTTPPPDPP